MKSWKVFIGTPWRGGRLKLASVASVAGSNMYIVGPFARTHTVTMRPWLSNVTLPQSPPWKVEST